MEELLQDASCHLELFSFKYDGAISFVDEKHFIFFFSYII